MLWNHRPGLKLDKNTTERVIQDALNYLIKELFVKFDNLTSLKYLNTHSWQCLNPAESEDSDYCEAKAPDCTFVYKNINISMSSQNNVRTKVIIPLKLDPGYSRMENPNLRSLLLNSILINTF